MLHSYNVEVATMEINGKKIGIQKAVLLFNISYWIMHNITNEKNYVDGRFWTYNTGKAYSEMFSEIGDYKTILRLLKELCDDGILINANYNKNKMCRTNWYALNDNFLFMLTDHLSVDNLDAYIKLKKEKLSGIEKNEKCISQKCEMNSQKCENDFSNLGNVYMYTDKNTNKNTNEKQLFSVRDEKNETCKNENQAAINQKAKITATTSRKKLDEATKDSLPDFINRELWEKYLAYKSERGEKLSRIGLQMKFAQWRKWHDEGIDVNECIRTAIANDWQGVFKPKKQKKAKETEKDLDEMSDNEFYELYGRFGFKNPKDYEKEATTHWQSEKNNFKGLL